MRIFSLLTLVAMLAAGCAPSAPPSPAPTRVWEANAANSLDLSVKLELSQRFMHAGEVLDVRITVTNVSDKPLTITANSGAPVYVKLYRINADKFMDEIRRYPQYATTVMKSWMLAPGESRMFPMQLTVAPDWPTNEPLRVVAEVNGRSEVQPGIYIQVMPGAAKAKATEAAVQPAQPQPTTQASQVRVEMKAESKAGNAPAPAVAANPAPIARPTASTTPASQPVIIPVDIENEPAVAPATKPAGSDESKAVENLIK